MSFGKEEADRKVIPIWDKSRLASALEENSAIKPVAHRTSNFSESSRLINELARSSLVGTAVELLSSATLENNYEGLNVASRRIIEDGSLPKSVLSMARRVLDQTEMESPVTEPKIRIASLRNSLRTSPRNTLAWVDLAREYLSLGQTKPAERAMTVALNLAPSHRWVSRVASTLFIHLEEYEKSHFLLAKHPALRSDPWIASAELSVAQLMGKTSRNLSAARRIQEQGLHPRHTTELASSLGTLEIESGAMKRGKMYLRNSLLYPNRNTLAQAVWAEQRHDIKYASHTQVQSLEIAYEAKARESFIQGEADSAISHALDWLEAEPFSSKPPVLASYIASLDDRYEQMLQITTRGLIANPGNSILKLNRAYAELALITPLQPTSKDVAKITEWTSLFDSALKEGGANHAQALANYGMLCYRMGALEQGRKYYEAAEKVCQSDSYHDPVLCTIYHAREAILAKAEWASMVLVRAQAVTLKISDVGKLEGTDSLSKIIRLHENPDGYREIFKLPVENHQATGEPSGHLKFADSIYHGLSFHLPEGFERI
ncbi:hypothetical protein HX788_04890 [Pseudomonas edaphica]|uniref:Tetratricopeptide repeat protein n=1 Tax=Pseudomonas edaphica TaxID=2006980 RepID=A0A7Y8FQH1_9PSED|nr:MULTISPECIES: hypothetical protein [Pseudomonas]NWC48925.1 hypothetical protein [Pseudomonas sp. IPO3747]NWE06421.1 hypothetical protein [Pseudomonas edaphica]NWE83258.1 hypothetical protein [Pseudomonas edaphica]